MNERPRLSDEQITGLLRRRSARPAPDELALAVLESLASERGLHPIRTTRRSAKRPLVLLAAAALLIFGGTLAAGSGVLRRPAVVPPVPAPSSTPVAIASPDATSPSPSMLASASPSPSAGQITWTQASLKEDWPAPVRPEPAGGASVAPMPPTYIDPSGDTGSNATSYVDIRDVTAGTDDLWFNLMSEPPNVDPSQAWIAYGLVVDEDRDGVPDWRYGVDNLPSTMAKDSHRAWRTNLHTGRTEFDPVPRPNGLGGRGDPLPQVGDTHFGTRYPVDEGKDPEHFSRLSHFDFYYTADTAGGGGSNIGAKQNKPFYVWASVVLDGRVVASDFAPDTGWLLPSPSATPGGTYVAVGAGVGPLRISMDLPDGWTGGGPFVGPIASEGIGLQFLIADHPAEWACDASGHAIKPVVGPKVDDLVSFLARQPMIKISDNTDVTLDGYRGKYLEYTTYEDDNNCAPPEWPFRESAFHQVWILDVDGVRQVIDASAPRASEAVKAELRQIVYSIAIGP